MSYATSFVLAALHGSSRAGGRSWTVVNAATSAALHLAIEHGFVFDHDDMEHIFRVCRNTGSIDDYYSTACRYGNRSAAISLEKMLSRRPFFVRMKDRWPDSRQFPGAKPLDRAHVGMRFPWEGEYVRVTSVSDESITACSYHSDGHKETSVVKRRFTITRADLKAASRNDEEVE